MASITCEELQQDTIQDKLLLFNISGLANLGNSCWLNSILQCILAIPEMQKIFINPSINEELYSHIIKTLEPSDIHNYSIIFAKKQLTLTYQMQRLFSLIYKDNIKQIRPINFKKVLSTKIERFSNYNQQDAHEAFVAILDILHRETSSQVDINFKIFTEEYLLMFKQIKTLDLSDIDCCKLESKYPDIYELYKLWNFIIEYDTKSYSIIKHLFQTTIVSTLECPDCHFHTFNIEPTEILSVDIPLEQTIDTIEIDTHLEKLSHLSSDLLEHLRQQLIYRQTQTQIIELETCLRNFNKIEILSDGEEWDCPNCKSKVKAMKKLDIWIPPQILIIHLKRFNPDQSKINNKVIFPINDLNINPFMAKYPEKISKNIYDLICIINHVGTINSGHYFSFVKSTINGNWYCANDESINVINESDLITEAAYILIYRKK